MNDALGISLKYISLISATVGHGPLRAELFRTIIDSCNHLVLYIANKISFKYFFGIKKGLVFIPALFFTFSGYETFKHIYDSISSGLGVSEIPEYSMIPLLVI